MDDGPNPHPPQWSDRHCRQCSCSWKGWHGTWTNVSTNSCKSPMNMDLSSKRDKYAVKQTSVVFFRCVYDATGAHPDPEKVSGVHKMPAPKTATKLQKFLGLVTYLLPFIPSCFSSPHPTWVAEEKEQSSSATPPFRKHSTQSYHCFARIPHCGTSTSASLSPSSWYIPKRPRCCPPSRWPPSYLCLQGFLPV